MDLALSMTVQKVSQDWRDACSMQGQCWEKRWGLPGSTRAISASYARVNSIILRSTMQCAQGISPWNCKDSKGQRDPYISMRVPWLLWRSTRHIGHLKCLITPIRHARL